MTDSGESWEGKGERETEREIGDVGIGLLEETGKELKLEGGNASTAEPLSHRGPRDAGQRGTRCEYCQVCALRCQK